MSADAPKPWWNSPSAIGTFYCLYAVLSVILVALWSSGQLKGLWSPSGDPVLNFLLDSVWVAVFLVMLVGFVIALIAFFVLGLAFVVVWTVVRAWWSLTTMSPTGGLIGIALAGGALSPIWFYRAEVQAGVEWCIERLFYLQSLLTGPHPQLPDTKALRHEIKEEFWRTAPSYLQETQENERRKQRGEPTDVTTQVSIVPVDAHWCRTGSCLSDDIFDECRASARQMPNQTERKKTRAALDDLQEIRDRVLGRYGVVVALRTTGGVMAENFDLQERTLYGQMVQLQQAVPDLPAVPTVAAQFQGWLDEVRQRFEIKQKTKTFAVQTEFLKQLNEMAAQLTRLQNVKKEAIAQSKEIDVRIASADLQLDRVSQERRAVQQQSRRQSQSPEERFGAIFAQNVRSLKGLRQAYEQAMDENPHPEDRAAIERIYEAHRQRILNRT